MTFELADLEALGAKAAADFKESLRIGTQQGQPAFDLAVAKLMGKVEFAYGVAARLAHREPTLKARRPSGPKSSPSATHLPLSCSPWRPTIRPVARRMIAFSITAT